MSNSLPAQFASSAILVAFVGAVSLPGCGSDSATAAHDRPPVEAPTPEAQEPADPQRVLEKTFDDIKFDIEPDAQFERSMLTEEIEDLAGRRIRIRGYIYPSFQKRLKEFVLVRDNQECCFGPGAALYDCIYVKMQEGKTAQFSTRPVAVMGTFRIQIFKPFDRVMAIFEMEGEEVE